MARTRYPLPRRELEEASLKTKLEMSLAQLDLPVRTVNCLEEHGISSVGQLLNSTPEILLGFPNFGEKTLRDVYRALDQIGFARSV